MSERPPGPDVTALLVQWQQGDHDALERLVPLVYAELRRVARRHLKSERAGHSLQPTALVHEAYLRLVGLDRLTINNRTHFFAVAGRLMRQVLVDHARRKRADKRGGGDIALDVDAVLLPVPPVSVDLLALDEALEALTTLDARLCQVVELKFFAGLSIDESAQALGVSSATVERDWAIAKAWLHQRLWSPSP